MNDYWILYVLLLVVVLLILRDFKFVKTYQIIRTCERYCIDEQYDRVTGHWCYVYNDDFCETVSKPRRVCNLTFISGSAFCDNCGHCWDIGDEPVNGRCEK